jgi:hypothetical protein
MEDLIKFEIHPIKNSFLNVSEEKLNDVSKTKQDLLHRDLSNPGLLLEKNKSLDWNCKIAYVNNFINENYQITFIKSI